MAKTTIKKYIRAINDLDLQLSGVQLRSLSPKKIKGLLDHCNLKIKFKNKYPSFINDIFEAYAPNKTQIKVVTSGLSSDLQHILLNELRLMNLFNICCVFSHCVLVEHNTGFVKVTKEMLDFLLAQLQLIENHGSIQLRRVRLDNDYKCQFDDCLRDAFLPRFEKLHWTIKVESWQVSIARQET